MGDVSTIRETPFGNCIGAKILDITTVETDEFVAGEPNHVYFHLDNGITFFATMGCEGEGLMGFIDMEAGGDDAD